MGVKDKEEGGEGSWESEILGVTAAQRRPRLTRKPEGTWERAGKFKTALNSWVTARCLGRPPAEEALAGAPGKTRRKPAQGVLPACRGSGPAGMSLGSGAGPWPQSPWGEAEAAAPAPGSAPGPELTWSSPPGPLSTAAGPARRAGSPAGTWTGRRRLDARARPRLRLSAPPIRAAGRREVPRRHRPGLAPPLPRGSSAQAEHAPWTKRCGAGRPPPRRSRLPAPPAGWRPPGLLAAAPGSAPGALAGPALSAPSTENMGSTGEKKLYATYKALSGVPDAKQSCCTFYVYC